MDQCALQDEFPITRNYAFFNNAGVAPLPRVAVNALAEYAADSSQHGWVDRPKWMEKTSSAKALVAAKIGCDVAEIAFCANTTTGISFVANGIDWRPGDNVVLANVEYPANVYPWWAQEQRGARLKFVSPANGRLRLEDYLAAIDDRTRAVAVSHVQFAAGFRMDLDALGKFCEERGIMLVVDDIQSLGVFPIDVRASRVSALACGVHKWLLSPLGLAIFYCRKDLCEKLTVWSPGADSVVRGPDYLDYSMKLREGAGRFENGALNLASIYALEAVLRMMNDLGADAIEKRVKDLTDRLCAGLAERGCDVFSPRGAGEWSGIVVFTHKQHSPAQIVDALKRQGVITLVREGRVRVSPHFYNSAEEIDRLLRALP